MVYGYSSKLILVMCLAENTVQLTFNNKEDTKYFLIQCNQCMMKNSLMLICAYSTVVICPTPLTIYVRKV
jgi:hypothetical protein